MFDGERGIALEPMMGVRASSNGDGGNLMVFLELHGILGFPRKLRLRCTLNASVYSATSGLLSSGTPRDYPRVVSVQ